MQNNTVRLEHILREIDRAQGNQSLRSFAKTIGVSPSYLSEVKRRKVRPGNKMLRHFEYEAARTQYFKFVYRRINNGEK